MHPFSTKVNGKEFNEATKVAVWKKLVDRREYLEPYGYDICGKLINFNEYKEN